MTSFDRTYELHPASNTNQKSFYGKATVAKALDDNGNVMSFLISYNTVVAMADPAGRVYMAPVLTSNPDLLSATTLRHITAFLEINEGVDGAHWQDMTKEAKNLNPGMARNSSRSFKQAVVNASYWMESQRHGSYFQHVAKLEQAQCVYDRTMKEAN
jgi:hypothetical protein